MTPEREIAPIKSETRRTSTTSPSRMMMLTKRERSLSPTQVRMLKNVRDGLSPQDHCYGMSALGGADGTLRSLVRRELLAYTDDYDLVITALGRVTLRDIQKANART